MHSGNYAFRDRRARKGEFRRLWIVRINAACREHDISYSRFVAGSEGRRHRGRPQDPRRPRRPRRGRVRCARRDGSRGARSRVTWPSPQCSARGIPRSAAPRAAARPQRPRRRARLRARRPSCRRGCARPRRRRSHAVYLGYGARAAFGWPRRARSGTGRPGRRAQGGRAREGRHDPHAPAGARRRRARHPAVGALGRRRARARRGRRRRPGQPRHAAAQRRGGRVARRAVVLHREFGRRPQPQDRTVVGRRTVRRDRGGGGRPDGGARDAGCRWSSPVRDPRRRGDDLRHRRPSTMPCAVVLGNEAHGLDPVLRRAVDAVFSIPMAGRRESLNVAMAGTVVALRGCTAAPRRLRVAAPDDACACGEPVNLDDARRLARRRARGRARVGAAAPSTAELDELERDLLRTALAGRRRSTRRSRAFDAGGAPARRARPSAPTEPRSPSSSRAAPRRARGRSRPRRRPSATAST